MNNSDGIAIHKWFDDEDRLLEGRNEAYSEKLIFFLRLKDSCLIIHLWLQLVFEGVRGSTDAGDLAVDGITVSDGFCPPIS